MIAFEVNTDVVKKMPENWADLLGTDYAKSVALAGNPSASVQALQGVLAAGLSNAAGDFARAAEAGLQFFADLNANGNFLPVAGGVATLADKSTPIVVRWDYLALKDRDALKADGPEDRGRSCRRPGSSPAPSPRRSAPVPRIPNAAKLWLEYLYSDEGQLAWLKAYCHPVRFKDLVEAGKVPKEIADTMPPAAAYDAVVFPTPEQQSEAGAADQRALEHDGRRRGDALKARPRFAAARLTGRCSPRPGARGAGSRDRR